MPNSSESGGGRGGSTGVVVGAVMSIILAMLAYPFLQLGVQWLRGNNYPGTVPQTGSVVMRAFAHGFATSVVSYHQQHDRWPDTLAEVAADSKMSEKMIHSYPSSDDLPDMRDIVKMKHFEDWIYLKPMKGQEHLPLIVAPRPFTRSMRETLSKPLRIIVKRDTIPELVEDSKVAPLLRARAAGGEH